MVDGCTWFTFTPPEVTDEGINWGDGVRPATRDYTPLYDAGRHELAYDFFIHDGGIASSWALAAKTGDKLVIGGPRGSMIVPLDYAWHLFAGDATAAPAIMIDSISENDSVADFSLKIFDTTLHTLMEVRERLDPQALQRAINAIAHAQRIEFYGFGASGAVAADAQHKFFRLLLTAAAYSDPHMQAMSAVTLKPTDVAICISQSGRSKDLLITANLVRESGATLITLCPSQTPLADLATVNLAIDVQEDTEIYTPLTSRIAHLVVIDVLAMGVAMARGPDLVNHLKSVKRSLRSLRLSPKAHKHNED